jgi:hypothetical protein
LIHVVQQVIELNLIKFSTALQLPEGAVPAGIIGKWNSLFRTKKLSRSSYKTMRIGA